MKNSDDEFGSSMFDDLDENQNSFSFCDELDDEWDDDEPPTEVDKQAVSWFKKMSDERVRRADYIGFLLWYIQNSEHRKVYRELVRWWRHPGTEQALRELNDKSEAEMATAKEGSWYESAAAPKLSLLFSAGIACVASVLVAAIIWLSQVPEPVQTQKALFQTAVGEQRREIKLIDGSTVDLNTNTKMLVVFENNVRHVTLIHGEAYFDVVKEKNGRPFEVMGGSGLVRVLGTAFEVRVHDNRMDVSVERGRVAVSPQNNSTLGRELIPRQRVAVAQHVLDKIQESAETVADWRDGKIEFRQRTLGEVVTELSKYHMGNITLADQRLSRKRVSGHYNVRDIDEAIKTLAMSTRLDYSTDDTGKVTLFDPKSLEEKVNGQVSGRRE